MCWTLVNVKSGLLLFFLRFPSPTFYHRLICKLRTPSSKIKNKSNIPILRNYFIIILLPDCQHRTTVLVRITYNHSCISLRRYRSKLTHDLFQQIFSKIIQYLLVFCQTLWLHRHRKSQLFEYIYLLIQLVSWKWWMSFHQHHLYVPQYTIHRFSRGKRFQGTHGIIYSFSCVWWYKMWIF